MINKQFSFQTAQTLKETIIDTLVRTRLKEGFKCLFKCPKFVVFTTQLTMFDSGEVTTVDTSGNESLSTPVTSTKPNTANTLGLPNSAPSKPQEFKQARGSTQICTFIYVIRFMNNPNLACFNQNHDNSSTSGAGMSRLGSKQGLLNVVSGMVPYTMSETGVAGRQCEEKIYFQTELYCEAIDGIYQERKSNAMYLSNKKMREKSTLDYFKNLNRLEICNLIYLIDLKCFSALQSIYALFLSKTNTIGNLNSHMASTTSAVPKLDKSNLSEFSAQVLNNISTFNVNFADSIRLLPDMDLVLKKHSLKESKSNSSR